MRYSYMSQVVFTAGTLWAFSAASSAAPSPSEPAPVAASTSQGGLTDAIIHGTPSFQARLRYEHAEIDDLKNGDAVTIRPRIGYLTQDYHGFDAFGEYSGTFAIGGTGHYNSGPPFLEATNGNSDYATIADPTDSILNQAWLRYSGLPDSTIKAGRQVIIYDDARFVGNVVWRQNEQTFDAVELTSHALGDNLTLHYAYLWRENFIFFNGNKMNSHLVNLNYALDKRLNITAFTYLLDFDNDGLPGERPRNPGAPDQRTSGLRFNGKLANVGYDLQFANQGQYADGPDTVDANYYKAELSYSQFPIVPTAGWEVAQGNGQYAFQFPLATNHAYFGWADVFLVTPVDGLRDAYAGLGFAPGRFSFHALYHDFNADNGNADYGEEVDASGGYKVNDQLSLLAKFADYNADRFSVDTRRYWLQAEYAF